MKIYNAIVDYPLGEGDVSMEVYEKGLGLFSRKVGPDGQPLEGKGAMARCSEMRESKEEEEEVPFDPTRCSRWDDRSGCLRL